MTVFFKKKTNMLTNLDKVECVLETSGAKKKRKVPGGKHMLICCKASRQATCKLTGCPTVLSFAKNCFGGILLAIFPTSFVSNKHESLPMLFATCAR